MRRTSLILALVALVAVPVATNADDDGTAPVLVNETYEKADARQVVAEIARLANANVLIPQDFGGTISVTFADAPWRSALEQVVRTRGFALVEEQYGILRVVKGVQPELETAHYRFRHVRLEGSTVQGASPSDMPPMPPLVAALNLILRRDHGAMQYIPEQNAVVYTGIPSVLEGVEALLKVFDQPRIPTAREIPEADAVAELPQVFVDTKAVRVRPSDVERFCLGTEPGVVSLDRAVALLKAWESASDVAIDDSFRPLLAMSGQDASMFVGETLEFDGDRIELGKNLAVTATVVPKRDALVVDLVATWRRLRNAHEGVRPAGWRPDVEVLIALTKREVANGAWVFLRSKLSGDDAILALVNFRLVRP